MAFFHSHTFPFVSVHLPDRAVLTSLQRNFHLKLISPFIEGGVPSPQSKRIASQRRRAALSLIFRYLNPIELCGLARVCREWRAMSEHPTLWKHVILKEIPLNNMVSILHCSRKIIF